jgi:hypothetical protein
LVGSALAAPTAAQQQEKRDRLKDLQEISDEVSWRREDKEGNLGIRRIKEGRGTTEGQGGTRRGGTRRGDKEGQGGTGGRGRRGPNFSFR